MTMITRSPIALAVVAWFATPALAGPPLICFPLETASGKSIPWGTLALTPKGSVVARNIAALNF